MLNGDNMISVMDIYNMPGLIIDFYLDLYEPGLNKYIFFK